VNAWRRVPSRMARPPRLLRLFPASWRDRYGEEVADLLQRSPQPVRDRIDLTRSLPGEHMLALAERRELMRWLPATAAVLVALGVGGAFWATLRLEDGWVEIPGHWWSTLAVLPGVLGLGLAAVAVAVTASRTRARRREH